MGSSNDGVFWPGGKTSMRFFPPCFYKQKVAAIIAAGSSKYISAAVNCEPVEAAFIFREMFTVVH